MYKLLRIRLCILRIWHNLIHQYYSIPALNRSSAFAVSLTRRPLSIQLTIERYPRPQLSLERPRLLQTWPDLVSPVWTSDECLKSLPPSNYYLRINCLPGGPNISISFNFDCVYLFPFSPVSISSYKKPHTFEINVHITPPNCTL